MYLKNLWYNSVMRKFLLLLLPFLFFGCATTVSSYVDRPAELDLNGAKKLSVFPFEVTNGTYRENYNPISSNSLTENFLRNLISENYPASDNSQWETANYIKNSLSNYINQSSYFQLVNAADVSYSIRNNIKSPAEVYIAGRIDNFNVVVGANEHTREVTDNGKKKTERYYTFDKNVSMRLYYEIIDASASHRIIHSETVPINEKSKEYEHKSKLPSDFSVIQSAIDSFVWNLSCKIQPYSEKLSLSLMKSKDDEMKAAEKLAENNLLDLALEKYLSIYNSSPDKSSERVFNSGYNAAQLHLVKGDYYEAKELMTTLAKTGNSKAIESLKKIQSEINSASKLKLQLEKRK